jgi:peroxiredoxin Q/BCP
MIFMYFSLSWASLFVGCCCCCCCCICSGAVLQGNKAYILLQGTKQACMFRDGYDFLTSTGFSIFGLSADSPKANTTFRTKQTLPYPLLSDTASTLIAALGLKKNPKGTSRGVFAVDKEGKVLLLQAGGPDATLEAARQLVKRISSDNGSKSDTEKLKSPGKDGK